MAKCTNCGKSGGLLKVNENGLCRHCEKNIKVDGINVTKIISSPNQQILEKFTIKSDLTIEELEVLIKFLKPLPKDYLLTLYWKLEYESISKKQLSTVIEKLISNKYIEPPSLDKILDYQFCVQELKEFCKQRELKRTGRKAELIERLIINDESGMKLEVKKNNLYICSNKGKILAKEYIDKRKEEKELAKKMILDFLEKKNFKSAIRTKILFQSNQFFNRGLGVEFLKEEEKNYIPLFERIFLETPPMLKELSEEKLFYFKVLTCFNHLWISSINHHITKQEKFSSRFSNKGIINLLFSYSSNKIELEKIRRDFRESNPEERKEMGLRIYTCNDDYVCEECNKLANRRYKIDGKIPDLPNPFCTCQDGCRCYYGLDIDF